MDKKSWGIKRVCLGCGIRFYDFGESPIVCPNCSMVFDPEYLSKRKTKNSQDKNNDADLRIDIADDILSSEDTEDDIVTLDEGDDNISLDDEKI
jgi:uncharacterized protein (TIGR02300 family)